MNNEDAITVLETGQRSLCQLFGQYRALAREKALAPRRQAVAEQICLRVNIQTRLEDELLYPLLREAQLATPELMAKAGREHASARELMGTLLLMDAAHPLFDSRVDVLAEYMEQHMAVERESMFARVRGSGLDTTLLGHRLRERQRELEAVPEALREEALVAMMA